MAKDLNISYLLDFYGDALTEKQREVMEQYFNDDLSLAEIASNFGITRQGVRDAIKRGEATVLELEQKIGFAARYSVVQNGIKKLETLARAVRFENEGSYTRSASIDTSTQDMLHIIKQISDGALATDVGGAAK